MSDKLIIEIDGNASGLTSELRKADSRLNTFNKKVAESNKVLQGFQNKINTSVNSISRLTTSTNTLNTTLKGVNRSFLGISKSLAAINKTAATTATSLNSMGKTAGVAANQFSKLATSTKAVNTMMTSMSRRMNALNATISALNTAMRGLVRNIGATGTAAGATTTIINRYTTASARASLATSRLTRHSHSLAEGFRRSVAQITALRTITYQALFWFAPLIYSIVKVNAGYEKQMVLLKNIARGTTEAAKAQEGAANYLWIQQKATENPFSMDAITDSFVKLRVAGVEPTGGALQALMDSVASFGGGTAQLERASVAIQQMAGKGVISMEELRQQMGEHIPDAMKSMAQGLGLTMGELAKIVETGTLEATSSLNAMLAVLDSKHGGAAKKMMETWNGLIARLQTAWTKAWVKISQDGDAGGLMDTLKKKAEQLITFLDSADGSAFLRDVSQALGATLRAFSSLMEFVWEYRLEITRIAVIFAALWGGSLVIGILARIISSFGLLIRTIGIVSGVLMTLGRVITLFSILTARGATVSVALKMALSGTAASAMLARINMLLFNTAGRMTIGTIGGITASLVVMTGGVWLLVVALGAAIGSLMEFNALQGQANQLKASSAALDEAQKGGIWGDGDANRASAVNKERVNRTIAEKGEYWSDMSGKKRYASEAEFIKHNGISTARKRVALDDAGKKFYANAADKWANTIKQKDINTKQFAQTAKETTAGTTLDHTLPGGAGNKKFATLESIDNKYTLLSSQAGDDGEKQRALALAKLKEKEPIIAARRQMLERLIQNGTPEQKKAAQGKLQEMIDAGEQNMAWQDSLTGGPSTTTEDDPDKKKPKKSGGSKVDPAERFRNKFETEFGQTAELENEYRNIRDGTDNVFDAEAAHEAAVAASRGKSIAQLKELIVLEQSKQRELKKSIAVEKAILDIQDQTALTLAAVELGYAKLEKGYDSIELAAKAFREELEREHRAELAIIEARIAANDVTQEQINQYRELKESIELSIEAKKAEAILDLAIRANDASKDNRRSFQSSRRNAIEDLNDERKPISEAIGIIKSSPEDFDRRRVEITNQLYDAQERVRKARADGDEAEILVQGRKIKELTTINALMEQGLPFLEKRNAEIEKEIAAREKWNGAGAPLLDWAKEAAKDMDDLGASMGNLLVNQFDSLIDGFINGKVAFGDFVKSMLKGLLAIIIRAMIAKAILAALGYGGGSTGGGNDAYTKAAASGDYRGIGHSGMIAGKQAPQHRHISAGTFDFARRYHTGGIVGLRPNEVPIIAERGEGVFTKEQMKAMGGSANASSNVQVNVINQTGTEAKVERSQPKFDGEKWVEEIILKKMSQPGPVRTMIQGGKR